MEKKFYKITRKDLYDLFTRLSDNYRVVVPYVKGERLYFDEFNPEKEDKIELGGIRQSQPVKSFINPPRESMKNGDSPHLGENYRPGTVPIFQKPLILTGVKACDLASFVLQDFVFLKGDTADPFYAANRDNTIIIGNDCTYAKETCFCVAMEGAPYPRKYFDINLSPVNDFFLVEVATPKGEAIINNFKMFFKAHTATDLNIRQANRERGSFKDE